MSPKEFAAFECERLGSYARIIEVSLNGNSDLDPVERQVIMEVVNRAIEGEQEFVREDPVTYMDLYYER